MIGATSVNKAREGGGVSEQAGHRCRASVGHVQRGPSSARVRLRAGHVLDQGHEVETEPGQGLKQGQHPGREAVYTP